MKCICGEKKASVFDEKIPQNNSTDNSYQILKCLKCSTYRTSPAPITKSADQKGFYQNPDYFESARRDKEWWISLQDPILHEIIKHKKEGSFLDIGTGLGFLTYAADKYGFKAKGIDYNESVIKEGQIFFPHIDISTQDLSSLPTNHFDVIAINHVLEHVVDPLSFINELLNYLKPDGVLSIGIPNIEGGIPRLLRCLNKISPSLGKNWAWQGYQLDQHIWHFTPKTLEALINRANVEIKSINSKQNMGYGLTKIKSFKYQLASLFFKISNLFFGGDHLQITIQKKDSQP